MKCETKGEKGHGSTGACKGCVTGGEGVHNVRQSQYTQTSSYRFVSKFNSKQALAVTLLGGNGTLVALSYVCVRARMCVCVCVI